MPVMSKHVACQLQALPIRDDNYLWLLSNGTHALAVDPGDYSALHTALQAQQLQLATVLVTHRHHDHVDGLAELRQQHPHVPVYGPLGIAHITHRLNGGESLSIAELGLAVEVMDTGGHTLLHLSYYLPSENLLFCGDTLFSAGCGRIFDGSTVQLFASLQRICALPDHTWLCASHEYTLANLAFARHVDPDNIDLLARQQHAQQQRQQQLPTLPCRCGSVMKSATTRFYVPIIRPCKRVYSSSVHPYHPAQKPVLRPCVSTKTIGAAESGRKNSLLLYFVTVLRAFHPPLTCFRRIRLPKISRFIYSAGEFWHALLA